MQTIGNNSSAEAYKYGKYSTFIIKSRKSFQNTPWCPCYVDTCTLHFFTETSNFVFVLFSSSFSHFVIFSMKLVASFSGLDNLRWLFIVSCLCSVIKTPGTLTSNILASHEKDLNYDEPEVKKKKKIFKDSKPDSDTQLTRQVMKNHFFSYSLLQKHAYSVCWVL